MKDSLAKLSSPKDWPENWPQLRTIDNLLRCSICSEYFTDATVVPACSHNYCSLCIRRYLSINSNSKCPSCPATVTDTELQNNRIIDEIVKSFQQLRGQLLKVVTENGKNEKQSKQTNQSNISDRGIQKNTSKFFKSVLPEDSDSAQTSGISQKRQREMSKSPTSDQPPSNDASTSPVLRKKLKCLSQEHAVGESSDDDISIIEKPTPPESPVASSSNVQTEASVGKEDLVDCPVCCQKIAASKINSHLDTCLTSKDRKENLRGSPQSSCSSSQNAQTSSPVGANSLIPKVTKRKPLNKLVYTLLSEKQLKQKLKEHGLSIKGDRQTLVKRHQEFALIYNSECSKERPKSVFEIVRMVEGGEKRKKKPDNSSKRLKFERGQSQEDIDKMKDDYVSENQDEFARLINEAKRRGKKRDNVEGEKSDAVKCPRKSKKSTPFKKKDLIFGKHLCSDDETDSNSSADFQPASQKFNTPGRKSSRIVTKRVTRSSTKGSKDGKDDCKEHSKDDSDITPDLSEVCVSDKGSVDSETNSPAALPDSTSPFPDAPSPSLLNTFDLIDSDKNSSDDETLFPEAFGPPSPTPKMNELQATPPAANNRDDSDEF